MGVDEGNAVQTIRQLFVLFGHFVINILLHALIQLSLKDFQVPVIGFNISQRHLKGVPV